ncbi:MAG: tRNA (adenosine(37)-N6)-threonylcarbamoyltransferase complex dimerization subunit type 1 TsaB [Planctomycetaceae bacterium]
MKILAIETSGMEASVALADAEGLRVESVLDTAGRRNARLLVPAVQELLLKCDWQPADIGVVSVSIGPGSFTGLRVGVVFAKTFAWINNAKLVAIDTLQGLAQRLAPADGDITVISDAQRGDVFVNAYHHVAQQAALQPCGPVRIECFETVVDAIPSGHVLTGPAVLKFRDQLSPSIVVAADDLLEPRANALLPATRESIARSNWADQDSLEPVYLRRSYAEEKRNAETGT